MTATAASRTTRAHRRRRAGTAPLATLAAGMLVAGLASAAPVSAHEAADPSDGTVSLDAPTVTWEGQHYVAGSSPGASCAVPSDDVCDLFVLTVDVDKAHWESADGGVEIGISWPDPQNDFDLHVFDESGENVASSTNENSETGVPEEKVFVDNAAGVYDVLVNPFNVIDSGYDGRAQLHSFKKTGKPGKPGKPGDEPGEVPDEPLFDVACRQGLAGPFPCQNVDLAAYLPLSAIGDANRGNDIWGWTDPDTGNEYALMGTTSGTAFVDVTEPTAPVYLGMLPSHQPLVRTVFRQWSDIKVYRDHAFVVSEEPSHGMQVFDLTRLRGATGPQTWSEDAHYPLFGGAHNIAINEATGYAYAVGTATCDGGPHIVDIRVPQNPDFAGCVAADGYTHDTQAVTYTGPDARFTGREILFSSNEDTLTIVDVTNKTNPIQLSRTPYQGVGYTHQGWLTPDQRFFLLDDELDEVNFGHNTTTRIFDVASLTNPSLHATYVGPTPAIDHNLYVNGTRVYEANYRAGLRILDASRIDAGTLREVGYFDVYPPDDAAEFNGAWSTYPFFTSGTVVVSGIEQGLFILTPTGRAR